MNTGARDAVAFLTRVPLARADLYPGSLSRAAIWFPAVGALVGGLVAIVRAGAGAILPAEPATAIALLAGVLVTGALHEDGLADVADAFGAHATTERRLEIMRDPRVGTYGALAIGFSLLLSFSLLTPLGSERFAQAVLCAHVLSRCAPVTLSRLLPPVRATGSGALLRAGTATTLAVVAMGAGFALAIVGPAAGVVTVVAAALAGSAFAGLAWRLVGGVTGDVHGAATKIVELAAYAALLAVWDT